MLTDMLLKFIYAAKNGFRFILSCFIFHTFMQHNVFQKHLKRYLINIFWVWLMVLMSFK